MIKAIDHYYEKRYKTVGFAVDMKRLMEHGVTRIVWKYTWLDNSKFYYKVETNCGHTYLIGCDESNRSKHKMKLFFAVYKRISKIKGRLLW